MNEGSQRTPTQPENSSFVELLAAVKDIHNEVKQLSKAVGQIDQRISDSEGHMRQVIADTVASEVYAALGITHSF